MESPLTEGKAHSTDSSFPVAHAPNNPTIYSRYGNLAWTLALPWSGQSAFNAAEDKPWKIEDGTQVRTAARVLS